MEIEDFIKICRACSNERKNLLNLFAIDCENEPTLGEKFSFCTSIKILENDDLPQNICYSCAKQLEAAYQFNIMCKTTDTELKKRIIENKPQIKSEDHQVDTNEYSLEENVDCQFIDESLEEEEIDLGDVFLSKSNEKIPSGCTIIEDSVSGREESQSPDLVPTVIEIEDSDKRYSCNQCNKKFYTPKALELHNKIHHKIVKHASPVVRRSTGSALEECVECDLVFGSKEDYKQHMRIHQNSYTNKCKLCGKIMKSKMALKNHLKIHDENGDRPYSCNICGKEYTEYRYLSRHMLYHKSTLYRCTENYCTRTYSIKHK